MLCCLSISYLSLLNTTTEYLNPMKVGDRGSLWKVFICLMEAVVSSSFTALSEACFLTLKYVDFVEGAQ